MKKTYILTTSLAACIILYLVEQVFVVDYLTKTMIKLILFIAIPLIYTTAIQKSGIKEALKLNKMKLSFNIFDWYFQLLVR